MMIVWWMAPVIFLFMVLMFTFWIATCHESMSALMAAAFLIVCAPFVVGFWIFFYLLSFFPIFK